MYKNIFPPAILDAYKLGHGDQYPDFVETVFSNFTARSDKYLDIPEEYKDGKYVVLGVDRAVRDLVTYWEDNFFSLSEEDFSVQLDEFLQTIISFVGPNGTDSIRRRLTTLYKSPIRTLPIHFNLAPEGTVLPIGVPCFTLQNFYPDNYWLTNSIETWLSAEVWKTCTIATIARFYRKLLWKYCNLTGGIPELIDWQAHDFSMRGMSGVSDSTKSAIGHLLYFTGTDTVPAVYEVKRAFLGTPTDSLIGGSVPATEHSVASSFYLESGNDTSKSDSAYVRSMVTKYPSGIVSIVSDTFDYFKLISEIALEHRELILNRVPDQFGIAKTVFRPDSGDPIKIICGDDSAEPGTNEFKGSLEILWDVFGGSYTETGHRLLNPRVGLIYGDSITPQRACDILQRMYEQGWCSSNIVFGVGSFTYQRITRDTLGFAIKATAINNRPTFKDPKTDNGAKKSARGLLTVSRDLKLEEHDNLPSYLKAMNGNLLRPFYQTAPTKYDFTQLRYKAIVEAQQ